MSSVPRFDKKQRVIEDLIHQIETGALRRGDQLPGEHVLAEQFQVSRGTVRGALLELNERSFIQTQSGIGSFVTFDGVNLDQRTGWAMALHNAPGGVTTETLRIASVEPTPETLRHGASDVILVERRRLLAGVVISLERSYLPAIGALAQLPTAGLVDDSITRTIASAGLVAQNYYQSIGVRPLEPDDAELMNRPSGELMLTSSRVSTSADDGLVEHVESLLDPERFRIEIGGRAS